MIILLNLNHKLISKILASFNSLKVIILFQLINIIHYNKINNSPDGLIKINSFLIIFTIIIIKTIPGNNLLTLYPKECPIKNLNSIILSLSIQIKSIQDLNYLNQSINIIRLRKAKVCSHHIHQNFILSRELKFNIKMLIQNIIKEVDKFKKEDKIYSHRIHKKSQNYRHNHPIIL